MINITLLLTFLTFAHALNVGDTTNVAKDVFPLKIGRTWEYSYNRSAEQDPLSFPSGNSDIGFVSYTVLDSSLHVDTVQWTIKLVRYLNHSNWGAADTNYTIEDTTKFIIYEVLSGNHQLVADNSFLWVFPRYYIQVFRYQLTDSDSYAKMVFAVPPSSIPVYTFKFCTDTGLTHASYFFASNTLDYFLDAPLTSSKLTDVSAPARADTRIVTPFLFPNYPNPFNSSTVISFQLPSSSHTTIKIFNILGQEISTILDGFFPEGRNQIYWKASNLASGLYFIQLNAGRSFSTNKCIIIR
jgi:hypothetical protein